MNSTRRLTRAERIFWTIASIGSFGYLIAMFVQYLAS
ncbi:hypothetical protein SEA_PAULODIABOLI_389 [Microbacterium phage PauloDiaboli]|nr:hypothetical protein SEA_PAULODIABOLI_34 [Microbacterium phage PauloDiaboli]QIG58070.1 hypothetical protein SEA_PAULODIABOLI_389 [Microbacterium phage PauloDiaboli]